MRAADRPFHRLVLVCTNRRDDGRECYAAKGSEALFEELKARVKASVPGVRVSRSGCLDNCATGASVVIMPDGIWLGAVARDDLPAIVAHLSGDADIRKTLAG